MWDMHNLTTEEQARINRDSSNGKNTSLEVTSPLDDDYDVHIGLAGSGVVYATARPDNTTVSTSECSHWGHDRCICGMVE
tara:strand:+ start:903 stop:1142 length:240 start_codon:yes stop_codon:yes gene_type:complete